MALTLYAAPKAFRGHIATIQQNALASWAALPGDVRIILFGDEEGVPQAAAAISAEHRPEVTRTASGAPLLDDLMRQAHASAASAGDAKGTLCLVNADIVLPPRFAEAVRIAQARPAFLLVGRCLNVDVTQELEPARILELPGTPRGHDFIDYFAYSPGAFGEVPAFALGRAGFDNWLVWRAASAGGAVIDATPFVLARHQNHDYGHVPGGSGFTYGGEEAERNRALAGGRKATILDATHSIRADGTLHRNLRSLGGAHRRLHEARLGLGRLRARVA